MRSHLVFSVALLLLSSTDLARCSDMFSLWQVDGGDAITHSKDTASPTKQAMHSKKGKGGLITTKRKMGSMKDSRSKTMKLRKPRSPKSKSASRSKMMGDKSKGHITNSTVPEDHENAVFKGKGKGYSSSKSNKPPSKMKKKANMM